MIDFQIYDLMTLNINSNVYTALLPLNWSCLGLKNIKLCNLFVSNNISVITFQHIMKQISSCLSNAIGVLLQLEWLNLDWSFILKRTQLNLNLLEPFIAFRRVLLQILNCKDCTIQHLLQSAATLRKVAIFSYKMDVLNLEGSIVFNMLMFFRALDSLQQLLLCMSSSYLVLDQRVNKQHPICVLLEGYNLTLPFDIINCLFSFSLFFFLI